MSALGRARHAFGPEVEAEALAEAVAELRRDPQAPDPDFGAAIEKLEARRREQAKPKEGDARVDARLEPEGEAVEVRR